MLLPLDSKGQDLGSAVSHTQNRRKLSIQFSGRSTSLSKATLEAEMGSDRAFDPAAAYGRGLAADALDGPIGEVPVAQA